MKILEICNFSSGVCGVFTRVIEESKRLSELGHEVRIFSSRFTKSTNEIVKVNDKIADVKIQRFNSLMPGHGILKFLPGGESFMFFSFVKEALEFSPDIIITHNYRQFHTTESLRIARKLKKSGKKCKVFLVTHAPFPEGNITRSFSAKLAVWFYDKFIGPSTINKFDGIFVISHWEIPFLLKIGAKKEKIVYIPNGIPEEFFMQKKSKEKNKILFLGRISPKKKIETLISAVPHIKDKNIKIEIVGPQEKDYYKKLVNLIEKLKLKERIFFSEPVYDLEKKIDKIDSCKIFVLPSRVEGMPQSLIEAMSRGKIVIGSDSLAIRDLIKNNNGFLFEFDNPKDLARIINKISYSNTKKIKENAVNSVKHFSWNKIINTIEKEIK